jgi:imidazolonepropionase-like amidohydrolase
VILAQSPPKETVLIKAGRLVDVRSGRVLTDQAILIEGDRIKQVGSAQSIQFPTGARVIDLSNATLLPGLIDCHTHLTLEPGQTGYESLGI